MPNIMKIIQQLRPYVPDDDTYGRMSADLNDLVEASEWLLTTINKNYNELTWQSIEDFLIDLEVKYIKHVEFHSKSLRKDLNVVLENIAKKHPD